MPPTPAALRASVQVPAPAVYAPSWSSGTNGTLRRLAETAAPVDAADELDRLMTRLLEVWHRLRGRLSDPAALRELLAACGGAPAQPGGAVVGAVATYAQASFAARLEWLASTPVGDAGSTGASGAAQAAGSRAASTAPSSGGGSPAGATPPGDAASDLTLFASLSLSVRATFIRSSAAVVGQTRDGITVIDPRTVQTDRYQIRFESATAVRITDLASGEYTRVWGDPHVDVSTVDGDLNGEFGDLVASRDVTTFLLRDGTRIRFQAPDTGLIERIDVIRGDTRVRGTGMDPAVGAVGAFHEIGRADSAPAGDGDVVSAGEDGASWYDAAGRLVWGMRSAGEP